MAAYERAAEQFPDEIETGDLPDLAEAQNTWLTKDRAEPAIKLFGALKPEGIVGVGS